MVPEVPVGYRAHLDGLRSVAVYLVVLFHAGMNRMSGGFIGVDVFFVLSGYLVTQVLMRDLADHGRISFGRFYARRVRRLLPASAVALIGTAVAYSWVVSPVELRESIGGFKAAFLYVANWHFIRESTDYFATGQAESPVLHFWSLAVEEQFYLLWPLALAGLTVALARFGARMWPLVRVVVGCLALASLGWAVHMSTAAPDRAYYGTDTRAYQLLAGALVAMTPSLVARLRRVDRVAPAVAAVSVLGLVILSTDLLPGRPVFRGVVASTLTIVLVVSLELRGGPTTRVLASKPMVSLGRISYGTYLWHWPVIVVVARMVDFGPFQLAAVSMAVATGLAALSAEMLEVRFRTSPRLDLAPRLVAVAGLCSSLVLGLVIVEPMADRAQQIGPSKGSGEAVFEVAKGYLPLTPVPDDFDENALHEARFSRSFPCAPVTGEGCTLVEGSGRSVLLLGDSNGKMLQGPLYDLAVAEDLTFVTGARDGCPWQRGHFLESQDDIREVCEELHEYVYSSLLEQMKPDVVVAMGVLETKILDGTMDEERREALRTATGDSVERILDSGAALVVIEPLPRGPRNPNPLNCLGAATYVEECRFLTSTEPSWFEEELRDLDEDNDRMWAVDMDQVVCPALPVCDPYLEGIVVRWDDAHLTRDYAATLSDDLGGALRSLGLIDP